MAEVVGLAAAIAQFIDVGFRLSIKLNRFCTDVCNVPERVQDQL